MDHKDSQSWKALGAAMKGELGDLRVAIEHGADLSVADSFGRTAMLCACEGRHVECAVLVMESGGFKSEWRDRMGRDALSMAAMSGSLELCMLLAPLSNKASVDQSGYDALCWAAQMGSADCAKVLIGAGWSGHGHPGGKDALMLAAKSGAPGLCKMLLEAMGPESACSRDFMERCPAMHAAAMGDCEGMLALIQACPQSLEWVDLEGSGLLAAAAWNGQLGCLGALIDLGADLSKLDPDGNDCLWWAAAGGRSACCEALAPLLWPWPLKDSLNPAIAAREQGHPELHRWLVEFDLAQRLREDLAAGVAQAQEREPQPRL